MVATKQLVQVGGFHLFREVGHVLGEPETRTLDADLHQVSTEIEHGIVLQSRQSRITNNFSGQYFFVNAHELVNLPLAQKIWERRLDGSPDYWEALVVLGRYCNDDSTSAGTPRNEGMHSGLQRSVGLTRGTKNYNEMISGSMQVDTTQKITTSHFPFTSLQFLCLEKGKVRSCNLPWTWLCDSTRMGR